jgi:hypothetical protein
MLTPTLQSTTISNTPAGTAQREAALPTRDAAVAPPPPATKRDGPPTAPTEVLTLSSHRPTTEPTAPSPVYAEVWKDGLKVANIDTHGTVTSFSGPVASPLGGAIGGPWLAAVRAAQVAQAVGGEIRINGLTVDAGTAKMRARLEVTYGR